VSGQGIDGRLPGGTVTFLFTDIEESTELLKQLEDRYAALLATHRRIIRSTFRGHEGKEVDTQGDAFFYSFPRATDAVAGAVEAQRGLARHAWPEDVEVRVRMGLHTGEPLVGDEGYVGMDVHRAARVAHAGHGGQVLLSETTAALVRGGLPDGAGLLDLGRHRLKGLAHPERISQLVIEGLPTDFPPLKSIEALPPEVPWGVGPVQLPPFLQESQAGYPRREVFVGRERELERLQGFLDSALNGVGGLAFLSGGAGRGKTALMGEFARRAMDQHPALLVASGSCSAFTGSGDPYLPFRRIAAMLTGDLEPSIRSGLLEFSHARRIWEAIPIALQSLLDGGADLIGILVSAQDLRSRAAKVIEGSSVWLERLAALTEKGRSGRVQVGQAGIFDAFLRLVDEICSERPLIFLLDDLQWADDASIDMLFHMGRSLDGRRALILGAYRPEGIHAEGADGQSPLGRLVAEFKRQRGDIRIDLEEISESEGRRFVRELLEKEFELFDPELQDSLFHRTRGHPLFTVELLREIRSRGQLARDHEGRWMLAQGAKWEVLPARVEGAIEARLAGLDSDLHDLLAVASVEGEEFTAETLARVRGVDLGDLLGQLEILDRRHGLVRQKDTPEPVGRRLFTYQFKHQLFQIYLYEHLSAARKAHLHGRFAEEIEDLFSEVLEDAAVELAWHYTRAGKVTNAIPYMIQAGDRAARMAAPKEAVKHYQRGLELICVLPEGEARDQQELELDVGLMLSLITLKGYGHPDVGVVLQRAMELGRGVGDPPQLFIPGIGYAAFLGAIAEYDQGQEAWANLMAMAERMGDPLFMALSHWPGWISLMQGDFSSAFGHMQHIIEFYDPEQHSELRHTFGVDPGAISRLWAAWALWFLGYPDQGEQMILEAFELAEELEHPHTTAFVTGMGCLVHWLRGDSSRMREWGEVALAVSDEHGIRKFYGDGLINIGAWQVEAGRHEDGIARIREGISVVAETGTRLGHSINLLRLAEALGEAGEREEAIQILDRWEDFVAETGEEILAAEGQRLRGNLCLADGMAEDQVGEMYLHALEIARGQGARSLELRVLIDLCLLWVEEQRGQGAIEQLRDCFRMFDEGFGTRDLRAAAALLNLE
jgi:class 3 adenylate cyclase/tetratricopeptide (TPR) repeat protein